jgi:hypothetical protein
VTARAAECDGFLVVRDYFRDYLVDLGQSDVDEAVRRTAALTCIALERVDRTSRTTAAISGQHPAR